MKEPKFRLKSQDVVGMPEELLIPNPDGMTYKPIEPIYCKNTGRTLTEWYETPQLTEEEIRELALLKAGLDKPISKLGKNMTPEEIEQHMAYVGYINSHKRRKFPGSMTKQEVAYRLDKASKMVDETNPKFLDKATQDRTGLEVNPLYEMEVLARSGTLTPKDQLAAWSKLADFTHSKAATITQNNHTMTLDEMLLDLAKEEYPVIDVTPTETASHGQGKQYIAKLEARDATISKANEATDIAVAEAIDEFAGLDLEGIYSDDTSTTESEDT